MIFMGFEKIRHCVGRAAGATFAACLMPGHDEPARPPRRTANVTLPEPLSHDAKAHGINLSQACEDGLAAAVAKAQAAVWLKENRSGSEAWKDHVEVHGIPLAEFREF
jgi:antitoxin CcdA